MVATIPFDFDKALDNLAYGLMYKMKELNKKQGLNPGIKNNIPSEETHQKIKKGMSDFLDEFVKVVEP